MRRIRMPESSPRGARWILAVAAVLAMVAAGASSQASETITIEPAGTVTWNQLLQAEARSAAAPPAAVHQVVPIMPAPPPREIGPAPARSYQAPAAALEPPAGGYEPAPPTLANNFLALPDDNTSIPPDTMGAAGPSHLLTMLNSQVRIQNKAGGGLSTVSLATFWTSGTGLSGSPFDPHVVYDSTSGRWLAVVDANSNGPTSRVWFAISATSDPTLAWTYYGFTADAGGATWADFPGLGVNGTWIAITNNMFTVSPSPGFSGAKMWVIDKTTALAGGPLTVTVFPTGFDLSGGVDGFALKPAVTFGASATLYILDNSGWSAGGTSLMRLSRITGTGPAPVWSAAAGSPFANTGLFFVANNFDFGQIGAEQLGVPSTCSGGTFNGSACLTDANCDPPSGGVCRRLDTGDPRLGSGVVFRNGRLWTAHSGGLPVGAVDRTAVFWYQIDPAAMPTPIVQSGVVDGGAGVHHFFPSIAANVNDDAVLGFSRADASRYPEAVFTGRLAAEMAGTMGPVSVLKAGEDNYFKTFGGDSNRWGDYSATVVDPSDDQTMWTIQEYAATSVGGGPFDDRWGTWWGQFPAAASPTPTNTGLETPIDTSTPTPSATPTNTVDPSCPGTPAAGCLPPGKSLLLLRDRNPAGPSTGDKLLWKWLKGPASTQGDFGDPTTGTSLRLCLYDSAGLIAQLDAPAGGTCAGKPCWKTLGSSGYKLKDADSSGRLTITLKSGSAGRSKIIVKAKNADMPAVGMPLDTSTGVTVQLHRTDAATPCWQAFYPGPAIANEVEKFKDDIP